MKDKYTWETYVAIFLLVLGAGFVLWSVHPIWERQWLVDDAFITLTYARNLVEGNGFVYNHPPATLGSTTPFFAFLTAFFSLILPGVTVIESAILLSAASWIGVGIVLYLMARHLALRPFASAAVAILPLCVVNSRWLGYIGMEMWTFQFLFVLSFYLAFKQRQFLAGIVVACLFLTRGEGVLAATILGLYFLIVNRRIPYRFIFGGLTVFLIWTVYALFTFGSIFPNTLTAKRAHREFYVRRGRDFSFLGTIAKLLLSYLKSFNLSSSLFSNLFLISAILGAAVVLLKKNIQWMLFLVWAVVYLTGYSILNTATSPWYALHLYLVLEVMAGLGIAWIIQSAFRLDGARKTAGVIIACVLAGLLLIPIVSNGIKSAKSEKGDDRSEAYTALTEWLNNNTDPEDTVAYPEIGYLGYFARNRLIDLAGLIDPLIAANIGEHGLAWGFWHYEPKYYIYNEWIERQAILGGVRSAFNLYEKVATFEGGPKNTPVVVLRRIEKEKTTE